MRIAFYAAEGFETWLTHYLRENGARTQPEFPSILLDWLRDDGVGAVEEDYEIFLQTVALILLGTIHALTSPDQSTSPLCQLRLGPKDEWELSLDRDGFKTMMRRLKSEGS